MNPFDPILRFELTRIARRQRPTLWRFLYALTVAGIAALTYFAATEGWARRTRPQDLARVTAALFYGLFALQFALVLITPNWAADAIAGEKERRTLSFLLATPLQDWQIILSKLVAQVAQIAALVLAGLPVLCALQFFGGVEPLAILLGYVALAVTILSFASLTVLTSVYARTVRTAGQRASQAIIGYLVVMNVLGQLMRYWPGVATFPGGPVNVEDVADWLNAGNPFSVGATIAEAIRGGWRVAHPIMAAVRGYLLFHCILTAICLTWASRRLRAIAAIHADGPPPAKRTGIFRSPPRPPVSNRPVLWKALNLDFRQTRTVAGRTFARIVFILSFSPVAMLLISTAAYGPMKTLPEIMNVMIARGLVTIALSAALVMILSQTTGCIARERTKQTLDDLLLTSLTAEEILSQKWWASIVVVRWSLLWVGIHWVIAVLTGGLFPLAVPILILEWIVYAAFVASLGMYWAVCRRTARSAGVAGGLVLLAVSVAPVIVGLTVGAATDARGGWLFLPMALSPPTALWLSGVSWLEIVEARRSGFGELLPAATGVGIGIIVYGLLAWVLWRGACRRFSQARQG